MEVTPGTPAKRPRAKAQDTNAKAKVAKPRARKASAATKAAVATEVAAPEAAVSTPVIDAAVMPSPDQIEGMIATAAYYMAAERNFAPGHELDDWLEAERRVRATLFG